MPANNLQSELKLKKKQLVISAGLAAFFGVAVLVMGLVMLKPGVERINPTYGLEKFPLLDPTRNLLEQKDAITNFQGLRENLEEINKALPTSTKMSLYFEFLNTGANISINKDEKVWPVSLAKLPLAMLVMKKMENNEWRETDRLEVLDENLNSGSGSLYKENSGQNFEVQRLITEMLINSDNTAYRILKRNTTLEEREALAAELGLGELFSDQGKVSAKEYSRIFRSLYTASYLNQENSEKLLKLLSLNNFKEFLNTGMPLDVMYAHKQGENTKLNVFADSGIVYVENRPYIISVMVEISGQTNISGKDEAKNIMRSVSKQVYDSVKFK